VALAQRMYARALFAAAQEAGRVEGVSADLAALAEAIRDVPELDAFLRNPDVDTSAKEDVLGELTRDADELVQNFVRLVAEKGRAGELVDMSEELVALVAASQRRLTVELTTAQELSDAEAQHIVAMIERASGRTVEATRSVDPSLIGGIVLQIGSHRADGSVRGRIERLRHELVTAT
jgi:F-type H+-transporting ATPase subunit delta